jgi:hypothetical protein
MHRRSFVHAGLAATAGLLLPGAGRSALLGAPPSGWLDVLGPGLPARDVVAVTGDRKEVLLTEAALGELARSLRGRLLLADDAGYDEARHILNPSFDRFPALIVQATGAADIPFSTCVATPSPMRSASSDSRRGGTAGRTDLLPKTYQSTPCKRVVEPLMTIVVVFPSTASPRLRSLLCSWQ